MQTNCSLTVNWHFTNICNFKCRYCFAHESSSLEWKDYGAVLKKLAPYFKRINFVGGEPTASSFLVPLVLKAHSAGFNCSVVTNGFNFIHNFKTFESIFPLFSCVGLSIDSLFDKTNLKIGRCCTNRVITRKEYENLCVLVKSHGIKLKINTVVSKLNLYEDFTKFYEIVQPDRIKLFQVLKPNTNLINHYDNLLISKAEYEAFVLRHKTGDFAKNIVAEDNEAMKQGYYILDSECKFVDNKSGNKSPSLAKDEMTVEKALEYINVDAKKYQARYTA